MNAPKQPPTTDRGVSSKIAVKSAVASVDWLTVTTGVKRIGIAWSDTFTRCALANGHSFTKHWSFAGYEGWQTQGCRYGKRESDQDYILIVSGYRADEIWLDACPTARSITRLDLAVTIVLGNQTVGLPSAHYNALEKSGSRNYSLIVNHRGGETLYVGSRASDHYGRCYDKGSERGVGPGFCFRYEVVLKKPYTPSLMEVLLTRPSTTNETIYRTIQAFVWDWFDFRQVTPIFERSSTDAAVISREYSATTKDRKLRWLEKSVSPTVKKLISEGLLFDVTEMFGLTDLEPRGTLKRTE